MIKIQKEKLILFFFIIATIIPHFNYTIDRIGNQWFYLSIVLCLTSFFYFFREKINLISFYKSSWITKTIIWLFTLFIMISSISIIKASNKVESLIVISQYITIFFSLLLVTHISRNLENYYDFIFKSLYILLLVELFYTLSPIIEDFNNGNVSLRSNNYVGLMSNINITSFSILYKTSIIFYLFEKSKNYFFNLLHLLVLLSSITVILILGSRAAYISLTAILIFRVIAIFFLEDRRLILKNKLPGYLIISVIAILINLKLNKGLNFIDRASQITLDSSDTSINQRLNYYNSSLELISENPILGVGLGNWKYESINKNKFNIEGYIVPYYSHNDFLQVFSEVGVFGFIIYSMIFTLIAYIVLKNLSNNKYHFIACFFIAFIIDSMLNFPLGRVVSLIHLIFFISIIFYLNKEQYEK